MNSSEERVLLVADAYRYVSPSAYWVRDTNRNVYVVHNVAREIKRDDMLVLRRGELGRWELSI